MIWLAHPARSRSFLHRRGLRFRVVLLFTIVGADKLRWWWSIFGFRGLLRANLTIWRSPQMPVEKYTRAPEILAHCRRMGEKWDLYPQTLFQTECHEVRWDESVNRWIAKTDRGDVISARFLISAAGPLHRPKLCGVPGIESYTGHTMHTSRWWVIIRGWGLGARTDLLPAVSRDYEYTGGDSYGNLHKLGDKRVAIVGTGATAVQVIPNLGKHAKRLYVFQRTPSSIDVRNNRPTDPEWVKSLKPGWQKERDLNFTAITSLMPQEVDLGMICAVMPIGILGFTVWSHHSRRWMDGCVRRAV